MQMSASRTYDVEFFRRSSQGMPFTLGQSSPLQDNFDPVSQMGRRSTPSRELEGKPASNHRKRVPVACERCRKRKIKCSGDEGDGRGCLNCKNAGWDGCQFLRVRSWVRSWDAQVSVGDTGRNWQHQHRYHPYSNHRTVGNIANPHPYVQYPLPQYSQWQHGLDFGHCPTSNPATSWNRGNYNSTYPLYESEAANSYSSHPPAYMLPDPERPSSTNVGSWTGMSRDQQNSIWLEQLNNTSIPQHSNYISPSAYPLTPSSSHKSCKGLEGSNGRSQSAERLLPTPYLPKTLTSTESTSRDTPPLSAVSHHSSNGWQTDTASQTSSRTSCSEGHDFSSSRVLAVCSAQNLVFPYVAATESPQIGLLSSPHSGTTDTQPDISFSLQNPEMRRARDRVCQHGAGSASPRTSSLGYSYTSVLASSRRQHPSNSVRSLANGTPYMWKPAANSTNELSSDQEAADIVETHDSSNPASIASLSSTSTY